MIRTTKIFAVVICCLVLLVGATAQAGILAGHPLAYDDNNGPGPGGSWSGTAPFANDGLFGTVDWAVFRANDFNNNIAGVSGYVAPAGELVYAHQVFTGGPLLGATQLTILLDGHPAGNGGSFTATGISGVDSISSYADPDIADWLLDGETTAVMPSDGLVYSSTQRPQWTGIASLLDGGVSADTALPIGIPSSVTIPEPTTLFIALIATVALLVNRRGHRG